MKKLFVAFVAVVVLSSAFQSGAEAFVSSLTLDSRATLGVGQTSVVATGTIVCSAGDEADISVIVIQSSGKVETAGTGFATVTCTGTVQTYSAVVDIVVGTQFKNGPATTLFGASDATDGTGTMTFTQGIHIKK